MRACYLYSRVLLKITGVTLLGAYEIGGALREILPRAVVLGFGENENVCLVTVFWGG